MIYTYMAYLDGCELAKYTVCQPMDEKSARAALVEYLKSHYDGEIEVRLVCEAHGI